MKAQPVQKTVGGVTYEDRFAHLHDDTPEALAWQWARDAQTQAAMAASPNFSVVRDRLLQLASGTADYSVPRKRGPLWFSFVAEGDDMVLRTSPTPGEQGRDIASQKAISEAHGGGVVMMVFYEPSPNGCFVSVAWGLDGDMTGQWSTYDTATGRCVAEDKSSQVFHTTARPAWLPNESGYWLDGRNEEGLHRLRFIPIMDGTPERSDIVIPAELVEAKHAGLTLQISPDGRSAVAVSGPWERIALVHIDLETLEVRPFLPEGFEGECDGIWVDDETYLARVCSGLSRGRVVTIPAATSRDASTWREIVPESEGFMSWASVVANKIYVGDLVDVSLRVRVFQLDGTPIQTLPLENPGASLAMMWDRCIRGTDAFAISHETFSHSSLLFVHDAETGVLDRIGEPRHRLADVAAEQRFATSRDGTRIPYFLIRQRSVDSSRPQPLLVHAYGGFNSAQLPAFPSTFAPFIEAGGIFVVPGVRGGGEYGRAWHDGGRLFNQRNTIDDLEAVARALIDDGVSTPDKMAFHGHSNGGLMAGTAAVFQPQLWRVVVPSAPVFDMMEMLPRTAETAGLRAIMYEDYGDPDVPEVARSVIQWSPYQNIRDGVTYPAVYQIFGEQDAGCKPFHGRKFTARLDEANVGDRPVHLRVWRNIGHGAGNPAEAAAYEGEWLAFVMDQVGLRAVRSGEH